MILYVRVYENDWCPCCKRWMGWLNDEEGVMDNFGYAPDGGMIHANCRAVDPVFKLPRVHVSRKDFEVMRAEADEWLAKN